MKKAEFYNLVRTGASVTADTAVFSFSEVRMLAREALTSGATLTVIHADTFTSSEIHMIASEGKTHVIFPDIKMESG